MAKEGRGSTGKKLNPVIWIRPSNFCGANVPAVTGNGSFVMIGNKSHR